MTHQLHNLLTEELAKLTPKQIKAIVRIIEGEAVGVKMGRLIKTSYSCKWCGRVQGRANGNGNLRKMIQREHEADCKPDSGNEWSFAVSGATFYSKWGPEVKKALENARVVVASLALVETGQRLKIGTEAATDEILRQIGDPHAKDTDRGRMALGLLDRADFSTAAKSQGELDVEFTRQLEKVWGGDDDDKQL